MMQGAGDLMNSHFQRLLGPNNFSIGLELPLDNGRRQTLYQFLRLDLEANPHSPMKPLRFGGRIGRLALIEEPEALRESGVQHVGLHLHHSERPIVEVVEEITEYASPRFHGVI
jgi:hypothetical protein